VFKVTLTRIDTQPMRKDNYLICSVFPVNIANVKWSDVY